MALTKTPICDFGKKADNFELKSTDNKVISLNPKHHDALHGVAQIQLTRLDYINGFKNYEVRWYIKGFEYRHRLINRLSSLNNIIGKKILVWCEQGFGDTIQFSRYINKLVDAGAKVTFEVQSHLLTFFKRHFQETSSINISYGQYRSIKTYCQELFDYFKSFLS